MQYRKDKYGNELSLMGYGCMRFSKKGTSIDIDKAEKEVMEAIKQGVNYFDTAYVYPGNEVAVGEIFARNHCREQVYLATKLPHYLIKSLDGVKKKFNEQLERLQTTYVDYYLMHMLTDVSTWNKMVELKIPEWLEEKKKSGEIRQIGFSYHGNTGMFKQLVDAYDWDFCQIQYNYMDEHAQAGRAGLEYANEKGLPVIIMEPLRGGRLVDLLPQTAKDLFKQDQKQRTPADLAFRWLYDQPQVTCVLSGMNSIEMLEENIRTVEYATKIAFSQSDQQLVEQVKSEIEKSIKVGCTGCGYCMPCPHGVDIPVAFRCYNEIYSETRGGARREYIQCTVFRKETSNASLCVDCGKCEVHCPQNIPIRAELKNAAKELENITFHLTKQAVKLFRLW